MKYKTTTLSMSVHLNSDNPVFGESATTVTVEDEGGPFIILKQENSVLRFYLEELEMVVKAAQKLIAEYPKATTSEQTKSE